MSTTGFIQVFAPNVLCNKFLNIVIFLSLHYHTSSFTVSTKFVSLFQSCFLVFMGAVSFRLWIVLLECIICFNTYFTSVVPTALLLQCNWPVTEIRRVL